jgi:uncharacterized protein YuzE
VDFEGCDMLEIKVTRGNEVNHPMQIRHDHEGDVIRIKLNNKKAVDHIEVIGEVVVIGVDANSEIVDISILDAS